MGLSSSGHDMIHSPVARVVCVDDEHLQISLEECQDRLKTWLIVQYRVSEAVTMEIHFFAVSTFWLF